MARVQIVVKGLVQGVFFRASAVKIAQKRSLCGWVRNNPDGSVEALIEGSVESVEDATNWFRSGPSGAKVDTINITNEEYRNEFKDFTIRYD